MKSLLFAPAAIADIGAIWDYSAHHWGPDQADSYADAIRDACTALALGQAIGRPVTIRDGYRKHPAGSHMIYFRDEGAQLIVIRILHGRQDVDRHL